MPAPQPLSPAARQYERDGYVLFPEALDEQLVAEASDHVAWLLARHPDLRPEQLGHTLMTHDPFWHRLVADERLLDIAEQFIGPDIALFASHYICKPPRDGQAVLWHQDGSYWPLDPMEVITLWLAIDPATPENGCMRVVPGSHRLDLKGVRESREVANVLQSQMPLDFVDADRAVDCALPAGGVSVHHPNIVHGSEPNLSERRRCGLTIRYIPTTTRILGTPDGTPFPSAFLLRGCAAPGVNAYNPRPPYRHGEHMRFRGCDAPDDGAERAV